MNLTLVILDGGFSATYNFCPLQNILFKPIHCWFHHFSLIFNLIDVGWFGTLAEFVFFWNCLKRHCFRIAETNTGILVEEHKSKYATGGVAATVWKVTYVCCESPKNPLPTDTVSLACWNICLQVFSQYMLTVLWTLGMSVRACASLAVGLST